MKILMVGPFPGQISGMTLANKMIYEGLIENGHQVEIIDTNTDKEFTDLKKQGKFDAGKVVRSLKPIVSGCNKIFFKKFDVVYITPAQSYIGFMKYVPFIKCANLMNKPCYLHFHGGFVRKMYDSVTDSQRKNLDKYLNASSGVIVLGQSLKYMLEGIIPDNKILVSENGVERFFALKKEEFNKKVEALKESKTIKVLYLSNLMKTKGILELLEACKYLKEKDVDFKLDIAGAIEPEISDKVNEYLNELTGYVEYYGTVNGKVKKELLVNNEIFCLPTYYPNEGQPISILEAMTTGCAIVTTYQGGIIDIFKDKVNGTLCELNAKSIAEAIIKTKENIVEYSEENYKLANELYSDKMFVKRIEKILES